MSNISSWSSSDGALVWKEDDLVYKTNPSRLTSSWRTQMEKILTIWHPVLFVRFIRGGYITRYVSGYDLHGTLPFVLDGTCPPCTLEETRKPEVLDIFLKSIDVGESLGFTFGDISCGNILVDESGCYLIDYDSIVPYPLPPAVGVVWRQTLESVFGRSDILEFEEE